MLSVIIVTWNGMRHLPACLSALLPQLPPGAETILVDNGSSDGAADWARRAHPEVRVLALPENFGFAGGTNAGLRAARGDLLLLINDDAFAEPGFIAGMLGALADPSVGAVAGVLTFHHRPELVGSAGVRLLSDGVALDLWPARPVAELPDSPQPVAGPSGGAALYRRALLEDVGIFEAGFFSYLEDVDLCWRALLRGWRSVVAPGARARHVYSATGGQGSPLKQRMLARNRIRTLVRCVPGPILLPRLPQILAYDALAAGYGLATGRRATATGRLEALRELPRLLAERRAIQARRSATLREVARWLEPAPPPWRARDAQRRLDAILRERAVL